MMINFVRLSQSVHLVPVPPTLTKAHSGEKPASSGSKRDAHTATTSSLVFIGLREKGWAGKGWFASAMRAVDMSGGGQLWRERVGRKTSKP